MNQKYFKFGPSPDLRYSVNNSIHTGGRTYTQKLFTNLLFNYDISNKLSFKTSLHYDNSDHQADLGRFGLNIYDNTLHVIDTTFAPDYYRFSGYLYSGEAHLSYNINENHTIMGGISGESRYTTHLADLYSDYNGDKLFEGSTKKMPFYVNDYGSYMQADGKISKLGYILGVRATFLGISNKVYFTPRAGLVYNISKNSSIKALYGEAFRGPGPQEQYYKVPVLIYGSDAININLKPERIRTYELALDQSITDRFKVKINGFYLQIFDVINRRPATPEEINTINQPGMSSTSVYDNLGKQNIFGAEAEFNAYPTDYLNFFINGSYKDGEVFDIPSKTATKKDTLVSYDYLPFVEKYTATAGFTFKYKAFNFTPSFLMVGSKEGPFASNAIAPFKADSINKINAYTLLNLNLTYQFPQNIKLTISIRNLLDEKYYYPEDVRRRIAVVPGGPGRAIFFKISYGFVSSK